MDVRLFKYMAKRSALFVESFFFISKCPTVSENKPIYVMLKHLQSENI